VMKYFGLGDVMGSDVFSFGVFFVICSVLLPSDLVTYTIIYFSLLFAIVL
jgi:hypothetical protein